MTEQRGKQIQTE